MRDTKQAELPEDFERLLGEYWDIAFSEGRNGISGGDAANRVLSALRAHAAARNQPPAIAAVVRAAEEIKGQHIIDVDDDRGDGCDLCQALAVLNSEAKP